jgi:hypothetical protein
MLAGREQRRGLVMAQRRRSRTENKRQAIHRMAAVAFQIAAFPAIVGYCGLVMAATSALFEAETICRAAIASLTDRDPKLFQVTRTDGSVLFLSYARPIDNFVFAYRCKIRGDSVIWASEPGRWREDLKDDKITFEIVADGKQLRIINDHSGKSQTSVLFDLDELR